MNTQYLSNIIRKFILRGSLGEIEFVAFELIFLIMILAAVALVDTCMGK